MRASETGADGDQSFLVGAWKRYGPLVGLALTGTAGIAALLVLPPWLRTIIPRGLIRAASIAFLEILLAVYFVAIPAVVVAGVCASWGPPARAPP